MRARLTAVVAGALLVGALLLPAAAGAANTVSCTATATDGSGSYTTQVSPGLAKRYNGTTVVYQGVEYRITCGQ